MTSQSTAHGLHALLGLSYHGADWAWEVFSGYVVLAAVDPLNPRSLPVAGTAGRLIGP